MARAYADVGVTWDEPPLIDNGRWVWAWYASGFKDTSAVTGPVSRYGGLFDVLAFAVSRVSPLGPYETKHLLTSLVAVLGIVATWKMAALLRNSRAAFLSATLLTLTPAWLGHGLFNPKDIPFATGAAWSVYAMLLAAMEPVPSTYPAAERRSHPVSWRSVIISGCATGAALGVRAAGLFLLSYLAFGTIARSIASQPRSADKLRGIARDLLRNAPRVGVATLIAWFVMIASWPWAQHAPISRPLRAASAARHFRWNGRMLFRGEFVHSTHLPRSYLPTWFAVTLPEIYFLAGLCGVALCVRALWKRDPTARPGVGITCLALAVSLPLAAAMVTRPVLYDAHRHFLFVLPPLAALAGIALSDFMTALELPSALRNLAAAACIGLLTLTAVEMAQLHPYEYAYFNRITGGLPKAYGRFETDYWGASYREGVAWVIDNVRDKNGRRVRVCSCGYFDEVSHYLSESKPAAQHFQVVRNPEDADVFLATTRIGCRKAGGEVLHVVERQGVPLLYVIRTLRYETHGGV